MIRLLLVYILISTFIALPAQISATLDPNPSSISLSDVTSDEPTIAKATLKNTSETDTLVVSWTRNIVSLTEGWLSSVCDNNKCYGPDTESSPDNTPVTIPPGESSNLDIYIFPNQIVGAAEVEVTVTDLANSENTIKGVYNIDTTTPTVDLFGSNDIQIFPNPTVDAFQIKNDKAVRTIKIYNIIGKEVNRYNHIRGAQYEVSNYQKGIYIIRLFDQHDTMLKVLRLNKK